MVISPDAVAPSQNFLKEKTIRYISECIRNGDEDQLPPTPIVRFGENGELIAIDGHNLLAVKCFLSHRVDVHIARGPRDGLPPTTASATERNDELFDKFETVIADRDHLRDCGIRSIKDLVTKYEALLMDCFKNQTPD